MSSRTIVRDPAVLHGRWHLAGTLLPIAAIRDDFARGHADSLDSYHFAGLSREEIAAALAFAFPALRETTIEVGPTSVVICCACGERTPVHSARDVETEVLCVCGRCWAVQLGVEPTEPTELEQTS